MSTERERSLLGPRYTLFNTPDVISVCDLSKKTRRCDDNPKPLWFRTENLKRSISWR